MQEALIILSTSLFGKQLSEARIMSVVVCKGFFDLYSLYEKTFPQYLY